MNSQSGWSPRESQHLQPACRDPKTSSPEEPVNVCSLNLPCPIQVSACPDPEEQIPVQKCFLACILAHLISLVASELQSVDMRPEASGRESIEFRTKPKHGEHKTNKRLLERGHIFRAFRERALGRSLAPQCDTCVLN